MPHGSRTPADLCPESLRFILIKFLLLLVVRHLFLVANIVTTGKALITTSVALVTSSSFGKPFAVIECYARRLSCFGSVIAAVNHAHVEAAAFSQGRSCPGAWLLQASLSDPAGTQSPIFGWSVQRKQVQRPQGSCALEPLLASQCSKYPKVAFF